MPAHIRLSQFWMATRMRAHTFFVPPAVKPQWEERRNWSWLLKIIEQIARRHATATAVTVVAPCGDTRREIREGGDESPLDK